MQHRSDALETVKLFVHSFQQRSPFILRQEFLFPSYSRTRPGRRVNGLVGTVSTECEKGAVVLIHRVASAATSYFNHL
jgi:hypothetical protein